MTRDQENRIREIIKTNREIRSRLNLQEQELTAMLPVSKARRAVNSQKGYITLPGGEKLWYDVKEEKKFKRAKSGMTVVAGGGSG